MFTNMVRLKDLFFYMSFERRFISLIAMSIFITLSFDISFSQWSNLDYAQFNFINPINVSNIKGMSI